MSPEPPAVRRPTVFLSHRYRSVEVNLFFWRIISDVQKVTFRVDEGRSFTSATRLERLIRDADGFVGVYPLPGDPQEPWDLAALRHEARYFLLELGIAARGRGPAIVFCDHRYGPVLRSPPDVMVIEYDPQEIADAEDSALVARVHRAYRAFVDRLRSTMATRQGSRAHHSRTVGLLMPPECREEAGAALEQALNDGAWEPIHLPWPPRLDLELMTRLRRLDWVAMSLDHPVVQVAAGFALGHGVPLLPFRRGLGGARSQVMEEMLFGVSEVGHRKALLRWEAKDDLEARFRTHLKVIGQPPRYVRDDRQAIEYFQSAGLRKEQVFLSYASEDSAVAAEFSGLLKASFQKVFDYRAKGAIRAGENWMTELSDGLSASAVGVLLLSPDYWNSKWCRMEAERLYRGSVEGTARVLPVSLQRMRLPEPWDSVQYRALYQSSAVEIVADLVRDLAGAEPGQD